MQTEKELPSKKLVKVLRAFQAVAPKPADLKYLGGKSRLDIGELRPILKCLEGKGIVYRECNRFFMPISGRKFASDAIKEYDDGMKIKREGYSRLALEINNPLAAMLGYYNDSTGPVLLRDIIEDMDIPESTAYRLNKRLVKNNLVDGMKMPTTGTGGQRPTAYMLTDNGKSFVKSLYELQF